MYDDVERVIQRLENQANASGRIQSCAFCGTPLSMIEGYHVHDVKVPRRPHLVTIFGKKYRWTVVDGQYRLDMVV